MKIKQSSQVGIVEKIEKDVAFVSVGALTLQVVERFNPFK